jgi:Cd2+/Zn2+-exporting ATPase
MRDTKKYGIDNCNCCEVDVQFNKQADKSENKQHLKGVHQEAFVLNPYYLVGFSFVLLISGLLFEYVFKFSIFEGWFKFLWYILAYLPVALPVLIKSFESIKKGNLFTEFLLMSIATIGAFIIGEYPEGVAVMLFYTVGEIFQSVAVKRATENITSLLDVRPKVANVYRNGTYTQVNPETVDIGEKLMVKVGEKVPLDGILLSERASLNTSALTGESKPKTVLKSEKVMAGSINLSTVIEIESEKLFEDSSVAKILDLVKNASSRKAKTELLIRKLAKVYTPIVTYWAVAITFLPYLFVENYVFYDWFYKALIFLVISCPCALVVSIPLGYFGGLGAASKNGILFKGANYMDLLTKINTFVMDKTGTVTKGVFAIKEIVIMNGLETQDFMRYVLSLESKSTHPISKAIMEYDFTETLFEVNNIKEIPGKGLLGSINDKLVIAGNKELLQQFNVESPSELGRIVETVVLVSIDQQFAGYIIIADEIKEDAKNAINDIKKLGINDIVMLSGDKDSINQKVAQQLDISMAKGGLLPEDKLNEILKLKEDKTRTVAFVGDGINDAPVLAASDLGIAMGTMGSDVAIETADVVFQTDEPSKFITAYKISSSTKKVIWQNIFLAFGVKAIVLILGAVGLASMWQAVFSDVGVSLLAILNAVRLQKMQWG